MDILQVAQSTNPHRSAYPQFILTQSSFNPKKLRRLPACVHKNQVSVASLPLEHSPNITDSFVECDSGVYFIHPTPVIEGPDLSCRLCNGLEFFPNSRVVGQSGRPGYNAFVVISDDVTYTQDLTMSGYKVLRVPQFTVPAQDLHTLVGFSRYYIVTTNSILNRATGKKYHPSPVFMCGRDNRILEHNVSYDWQDKPFVIECEDNLALELEIKCPDHGVNACRVVVTQSGEALIMHRLCKTEIVGATYVLSPYYTTTKLPIDGRVVEIGTTGRGSILVIAVDENGYYIREVNCSKSEEATDKVYGVLSHSLTTRVRYKNECRRIKSAVSGE